MQPVCLFGFVRTLSRRYAMAPGNNVAASFRLAMCALMPRTKAAVACVDINQCVG